MKPAETSKKITVKTLDALKKKEHLPQDLVYLLGQIIALQDDARHGVCLDPACLSGASRQIEPGDSLFTPETLPLDREKCVALFDQILTMITDQAERVPAPMVGATAEIRRGLETGELDLSQAIHECLRGEGTILPAWATRTPEAPGALRFLILASLEPSLHALVETLTNRQPEQEINGGIRQTGRCPICGQLPYILELRGTEGFRFAVCSLCRHEYRIRRLACTVCDTSDPEQVKGFTVEEEPGFRVETCDTCHTYMKTIDFRALDREACPALNDLESLSLDFLAANQGFTRPTLSVWGI